MTTHPGGGEFRISQYQRCLKIRLRSAATTSIWHPRQLDDHFPFYRCVFECPDFDLRPHPDDPRFGPEGDDLPAIL
jgi:hypothetical protein